MDIDLIFTYHNPRGLDPKRFDNIRNAAKALEHEIMNHGGHKDEKKIAILKLREVVFYAIASIAVPEEAFNKD